VADAMVSLIQTTIGTVLGPLAGQLNAHRQTVERQAETIREQAEQIGELRATVAAQDARIATLTAPTSTQALEPSQPQPLPVWWRSPAVYVVGGISVTALVIGLVALLGR